jgi:hypothetical protein
MGEHITARAVPGCFVHFSVPPQMIDRFYSGSTEQLREHISARDQKPPQ